MEETVPGTSAVSAKTSRRSLQLEEYDVEPSHWSRTRSGSRASSSVPDVDVYLSTSSATQSGKGRSRGRVENRSKGHKDQLNASTITGNQIAVYFNDPELDNPSSVAEPNQELQGTDYIEVLNSLMEDMESKKFKFPSKSVGDLLRKIDVSTPEPVQNDVEERIMKPMTKLLTNFEFKCGTSTEQVQSYETLLERITAIWSQKSIPPIVSILEKLLVAALLPHDPGDDTGEDRCRVQFVKFWEMVLLLFSYKVPNASPPMVFELSMNGSGKNLPINILQSLKSTVPEDLESENDSDDDEDNKKSTFINVKPNLMFEAILHTSPPTKVLYGLKKLELSKVFRCFCMKVKTKQDGFVSSSQAGSGWQTSSPGANAGDCMSPPPSKKVKQRRSSDADQPLSPGSDSEAQNLPNSFSRIEQFKNPHFMELLSMMKSDEKGTVDLLGQVHAFGFFVVIHRIYVTAIDVHSPHGRQFADLPGKVQFVRNNVIGQKKCRYRMVCFKYFNMFNSEHLRALLEFMKYLIFHQYKEYQDFC